MFRGQFQLLLLKRFTGESVGDLAFISFRDVMIAGKKVRLYRGGMSGEVGYELFGDSADGSVIWNAVVEAEKNSAYVSWAREA